MQGSDMNMATSSRLSVNQNYHSVPGYRYRRSVVPMSRTSSFGKPSYSQIEDLLSNRLRRNSAPINGEHMRRPVPRRAFSQEMGRRTRFGQNSHPRQGYKDFSYLDDSSFKRVSSIVNSINMYKKLPLPADEMSQTGESYVYFSEETTPANSSAAHQKSVQTRLPPEAFDTFIRERKHTRQHKESGSHEQLNATEAENIDYEDNAETVTERRTENGVQIDDQHGYNSEHQQNSDMSFNASPPKHQRQNVMVKVWPNDTTDSLSTNSENLKQRMENLRAKIAKLRRYSGGRSSEAGHAEGETSSTDEEVVFWNREWLESERRSPIKAVRHDKNTNWNRERLDHGRMSPRKAAYQNRNMNMNGDYDMDYDMFQRCYTPVYCNQQPDTYWEQYMSTLIQDRDKNVNENSYETDAVLGSYSKYDKDVDSLDNKYVYDPYEPLQCYEDKWLRKDDSHMSYLTSKADCSHEGEQNIACNNSIESYAEEIDALEKNVGGSNDDFLDELVSQEIVMENYKRAFEDEAEYEGRDGCEDVPITDVWCKTIRVPAEQDSMKDISGGELDGVWLTTVTAPVDENMNVSQDKVDEHTNDDEVDESEKSNHAVESVIKETGEGLVDNTDSSPLNSAINDSFCLNMSSDSSLKRKYVKSYSSDGQKYYYVSTSDMSGNASSLAFTVEHDEYLEDSRDVMKEETDTNTETMAEAEDTVETFENIQDKSGDMEDCSEEVVGIAEDTTRDAEDIMEVVKEFKDEGDEPPRDCYDDNCEISEEDFDTDKNVMNDKCESQSMATSFMTNDESIADSSTTTSATLVATDVNSTLISLTDSTLVADVSDLYSD